MFFLVCLILVVMSIFWEIGYVAHAQSHPDMAPQPEQGGQTTLDKHDESSVLKTQKDQMNYAIGVNLIGNFKKQGVDIDLNQVIKGMQDAFSGEKLLMSDDEIRKAIIQYQAEVRRMQAEIRALTAEDNKKEGDAFLAENKKKDGVITLPSGLQYRIIKPGDGKKPIDTDTVECHYRGKHINGNEFDSSLPHGPSCNVQGKRRHLRLDGSAEAHAGRLHMAAFCSVRACLRRAGRRRNHRTERHAYF